MAEALSPTLLASLSNLINYSTLQTVLLDIVKTIEGLSRDVKGLKATVFQLTEDKVSKSEFNVFVGTMSGLQTKVEALDARFTKANDDAATALATRREMESQLDKMRQQISDLETKLNKTRVASFSSPPVDAEEIRKLQMLLGQKVEVDTFRDFREQTLRNEQKHASLKKSIQDAIDALNEKVSTTGKYENEMRQKQQQFYDTLTTYNNKLRELESLRELLESKMDQNAFDKRMKNIEIKLNQDLGEKEEKIKELYGALRKKADVTQLVELEQIMSSILNNDEGGTAAGRAQLKCLSCDRGYNTLSGSTIDIGSIPNRNTELRKSVGSPSSGRRVMMLGSDGVVYQGRDPTTIPEPEPETTPPSSARMTRTPSPSPLTSSRKTVRPLSAKR